MVVTRFKNASSRIDRFDTRLYILKLTNNKNKTWLIRIHKHVVRRLFKSWTAWICSKHQWMCQFHPRLDYQFVRFFRDWIWQIKIEGPKKKNRKWGRIYSLVCCQFSRFFLLQSLLLQSPLLQSIIWNSLLLQSLYSRHSKFSFVTIFDFVFSPSPFIFFSPFFFDTKLLKQKEHFRLASILVYLKNLFSKISAEKELLFECDFDTSLFCKTENVKNYFGDSISNFSSYFCFIYIKIFFFLILSISLILKYLTSFDKFVVVGVTFIWLFWFLFEDNFCFCFFSFQYFFLLFSWLGIGCGWNKL